VFTWFILESFLISMRVLYLSCGRVKDPIVRLVKSVPRVTNDWLHFDLPRPCARKALLVKTLLPQYSAQSPLSFRQLDPLPAKKPGVHGQKARTQESQSCAKGPQQ
jgi:hypothetical protein